MKQWCSLPVILHIDGVWSIDTGGVLWERDCLSPSSLKGEGESDSEVEVGGWGLGEWGWAVGGAEIVTESQSSSLCRVVKATTFWVHHVSLKSGAWFQIRNREKATKHLRSQCETRYTSHLRAKKK